MKPTLFDFPLSPMRRRMMQAAGSASLLALAGAHLRPAFAKDGSVVTLADIGVGDPGDWSRLVTATGTDVKLIAIGNAPSAVLNQLLAGGGQGTYDLVNIVGGMQEVLVEANLIDPIDTGRLKNWGSNQFISEYLAAGTPGHDFISHDGTIYGVPTVLQGEAFAYLPKHTGKLDSYGALFDPKFKGYVALEDNYTTAGQKTALFLKSEGLADIKDPADMTPDELRVVMDFLIERKKEGQFRVVWSSFEQAVSLLVNEEVHVMDCWEPMVFAAREKGIDAVYAAPKEGYLLWAMAAYIVRNPSRTDKELQAIYDVLDFMLDGWYGATVTLKTGYMTNPAAPEYAEANADEFSADDAARVREISDNVQGKFEAGGSWQTRWPTHVDAYEEEWQRFKAS